MKKSIFAAYGVQIFGVLALFIIFGTMSLAHADTTVNVRMDKLAGIFGAPDLPIFVDGADDPVCVLKEEGSCTFNVPAGKGVKVQFGSRLSLRNEYTSSARLDFVDGATQNYALVVPSAASKARSTGGGFGLIGVLVGAAIASGIEANVDAPANLLISNNVNYDLISVK